MRSKFFSLLFCLVLFSQVLFAREFQVISDEGFIRQGDQVLGRYPIGTVFNATEIKSARVFIRLDDGRLGWINESELQEVYQDNWQLGEAELEYVPESSTDLRVESEGSKSLRSRKFLGSTGGVNFEGTFTETHVKENGNFAIYYDEKGRDGERLVLIYADEIVIVPVADWLLVPIAKFVDNKYTSLVSLFGEGPDRENTYYIQYHSALRNTLIGLRLLQADMMLMSPQQFSKPMKQRGREILGKFEEPTSDYPSHSVLSKIYEIMEQSNHQSWVLTDTDSQKSIRLTTEGLQYVNKPYYFFWKSNNQAVEEWNQLARIHTQLVDRYNLLVKDYNDNVRRLSAYRATKSEAKELDREKAEIEKLVVRLESIERKLQKEPDVMPLTKINRSISENWNLLKRLNPNVYNAVEQTASLVALLSYFKNNHTSSWQKFFASIEEVKVIPKVYTPTQISKKPLQ